MTDDETWADVAIADEAKYGTDLRGTIDGLRANNDRMAAMLRRLEWSGTYFFPDAGGVSACPCCMCTRLECPDADGELPTHMGRHATDCTLAALLRELP